MSMRSEEGFLGPRPLHRTTARTHACCLCGSGSGLWQFCGASSTDPIPAPGCSFGACGKPPHHPAHLAHPSGTLGRAENGGCFWKSDAHLTAHQDLFALLQKRVRSPPTHFFGPREGMFLPACGCNARSHDTCRAELLSGTSCCQGLLATMCTRLMLSWRF